jgi:cyanophycin synthetase
VAVITNIAEDHIGLGGIDTLEKMARVKAVVAETVSQDGYAILNADDDLVYNMRDNLLCKVALFSMDENNPRVVSHCRYNGLAAVFTGTCIHILDGLHKIKIEKVCRIPVTFNGKAEFNIANVLGAVLAGYVSGFSVESIRKSMRSFIPSPELTPGRMNIFHFRDFTVMIDYAHNPHGMRAVGKFIQSVKAVSKTGIIAGVGDRRDEDLVAIGEEAAKIFDEVIVRMDDDPRGRTYQEIFELVSGGIKKFDQGKKITLIPDEAEAVHTAISSARAGSFVVVLTDRVSEAIQITRMLQEREQQKNNVPSKVTPVRKLSFMKKVAI